MWVPHHQPYRIRLQEATQRGIIKARPVIIQAQALLPPLAGETPVCGPEAALPPDDAIREIARDPRHIPALG
jgi:hypothetical protein